MPTVPAKARPTGRCWRSLRPPNRLFCSTPVLLNQSRFVDMQVIFPDYGYQHGRPAWLISLAGRTASPVPAALLPAAGRRLVLAYDKAHGADALAVDAVLVQAGQAAPSLMLPPGEMRLETQE